MLQIQVEIHHLLRILQEVQTQVEVQDLLTLQDLQILQIRVEIHHLLQIPLEIQDLQILQIQVD